MTRSVYLRPTGSTVATDSADSSTSITEPRREPNPNFETLQAKTLVLGTSDGLVRVVIPASAQLDLAKVKRALAVTGEVSLLTEAELGREYTEFELGAVPPLTGSHRDRVLVDRRLCECEWIVIEAGTHEESLRLRSADLLSLADAQLADVCAG